MTLTFAVASDREWQGHLVHRQWAIGASEITELAHRGNQQENGAGHG